MRKQFVLMTSVILLLVFVVLTGCSSNSSSTSSKPQNEKTEPAASPKDSGSTSQASSEMSPAPMPEKPKDDFPNKPLTIVIPFSPGVAGDTFSRTFGKIAEKYLGQPVVPVNKEGGSGAIGVTHMLAQPADGYTILYQSSTLAYTIAAGQMPFKASDIVPISVINADYQALSVKKDSPFQTYEDLLKYAKENPGKLKIGGTGTKSTNHVFALKIMKGAGIQANYIPYSGGSGTLTALLGGNVDAITTSSSVVNQQVEAGEVRILAVSSGQRIANRPDAPTFKELGLTDIDDELIWRAFFGKPGIPQERLDKLSEVFAQVIKDPEWQDYQKKSKQMDFYKDSKQFSQFFNKYVSEAEVMFKDLK